MQWQKKEEEEKRKMDEAEAARRLEEEAKAVAIEEISMERIRTLSTFLSRFMTS
jgi:hypothetical protein